MASLLLQVASLKEGRLLSSEEVLFSSYQLSGFSQGVSLSGGDLHAAGRLLRELIDAEEVLVGSETQHDGVPIVRVGVASAVWVWFQLCGCGLDCVGVVSIVQKLMHSVVMDFSSPGLSNSWQ